jgi:hypothetical protein
VGPQDITADFRTDDLALSAFLHTEGYAFSVETRGRKAYFVFPFVDDLYSAVDDYRDGIAQVEPRSLIQATGHCRKMMYDALGHDPRRRNGSS